MARGLREIGADDPALLGDADAHGDLELRCEARMALAGVAPIELALDLATQAVDLAAAAGPALEFAARVLRSELSYAANRRDLAMAEGDLQRALEIAAATGSAWHRLHIEADLAVIEAERGRVGAAIDRLRRVAVQAEEQGLRGQLRLALQNVSAFLLREGRAAEAAESAARTAELARDAGDPALRATALSLRADALRRTGALADALASAGEAEALQRAHGDRMQALTLLRRAAILAALHRSDDALADARASRRVAEAHGDRDLALAARLWENLHLARTDNGDRAALEQALADIAAAGVTLRPLTRSLVEDATSWLSAVAPTAAPGRPSRS